MPSTVSLFIKNIVMASVLFFISIILILLIRDGGVTSTLFMAVLACVLSFAAIIIYVRKLIVFYRLKPRLTVCKGTFTGIDHDYIYYNRRAWAIRVRVKIEIDKNGKVIPLRTGKIYPLRQVLAVTTDTAVYVGYTKDYKHVYIM